MTFSGGKTKTKHRLIKGESVHINIYIFGQQIHNMFVVGKETF